MVRKNRAEHLVKLRHLYVIPGPIPEEVEESEHLVPVRDGYKVRVRVYVPRKIPADGSAMIVELHEGGWTKGDLSDEDQNCRLFARDLGAVCVNVEYRLAPEHPFPTGVNDCYDVIKWIAATAPSSILPADLRQGFIVGGASAGGNMSAVVCQIGRDEGLNPPLTGQYLCVPALLGANVVPEKWKSEYRSRLESKNDPLFKNRTRPAAAVNQELKPDEASPLFSPLLHPDLKGLPPAFFQVAGLDPLRDEALIYERVLREENAVDTKINIYDGFGHMFWTNWSVAFLTVSTMELLIDFSIRPTMERSKEFVADTREGMQWLLEMGRRQRK